MNNSIKVLVVDDSSLFRQAIIQNLSTQAGIEIVGYAINAYDAKLKIPQLKPDVLTMDVRTATQTIILHRIPEAIAPYESAAGRSGIVSELKCI